MSHGLLAKGNNFIYQDNSLTTVYTVPANCYYATINIIILNRSETDAAIDIACHNATLTAFDANVNFDEYIESGVIVPANGGTYERTDLILSPNESIILNTFYDPLELYQRLVYRIYGHEVTKL